MKNHIRVMLMLQGYVKILIAKWKGLESEYEYVVSKSIDTIYLNLFPKCKMRSTILYFVHILLPSLLRLPDLGTYLYGCTKKL